MADKEERREEGRKRGGNEEWKEKRDKEKEGGKDKKGGRIFKIHVTIHYVPGTSCTLRWVSFQY